MRKIDPSRTDLAREFRAKPYGRHSDDLQRLLNIMRGGPNAGRLVALCIRRHKEWALGRLGATPLDPITRVDDRVFHTFDDIEWEIFKIRWHELTGQELSDA
jgi:hypothetical protein